MSQLWRSVQGQKPTSAKSFRSQKPSIREAWLYFLLYTDIVEKMSQLSFFALKPEGQLVFAEWKKYYNFALKPENKFVFSEWKKYYNNKKFIMTLEDL